MLLPLWGSLPLIVVVQMYIYSIWYIQCPFAKFCLDVTDNYPYQKVVYFKFILLSILSKVQAAYIFKYA